MSHSLIPPPFKAARQGMTYPDLPAVLAGLSRLRDDLRELASEIDPAVAAVTQALQAPGDKRRACRALEIQQAQLVWLAADTGAMLAALAEPVAGVAPRKERAMSDQRLSQPQITDPVAHLYNLAESLLHLGATLPEQEAGLALLLHILGDEVRHCAEMLDDGEKENA